METYPESSFYPYARSVAVYIRPLEERTLSLSISSLPVEAVGGGCEYEHFVMIQSADSWRVEMLQDFFGEGRYIDCFCSRCCFASLCVR